MPYSGFDDHSSVAKVAVVTGAAQGIGRRTAELLGKRGYSLVLCDVASCEETSAEISHNGGISIESRGDITIEENVRGIAATALERLGRIDVLVNNAGISHICPAEQTTAADWQRVMNVNLLGPFLLARDRFDHAETRGRKYHQRRVDRRAAWDSGPRGVQCK